ncbi:MAG: RidA family protein [Woeseiaceae bacterium]
MATRTNVHSGAPWEGVVGYCRAVKFGSHIAVSGTAPVGADGKVVGEGDAYLQAKRCLEIIAEALERAGASLDDVVRTRMFVTDISRWEDVGRAHEEVFGDVSPATTMVQVVGLIDPAMLVEIEADALLDED